MSGDAKTMRVLVLCTGNSCRSQMAEGFLQEYGQGRIIAASAGVAPSSVNPNAIKVMQEVGIDISGHTSDPVEKYLDEPWDYVITVCDNAKERCPVFPRDVNKLHWPFEDPADATGSVDEVLDLFRRVRDEIGVRVKAWARDKGICA